MATFKFVGKKCFFRLTGKTLKNGDTVQCKAVVIPESFKDVFVKVSDDPIFEEEREIVLPEKQTQFEIVEEEESRKKKRFSVVNTTTGVACHEGFLTFEDAEKLKGSL